MPEKSEALPAPASDSPQPYYPSLYLDNHPDLSELPDEGHATIKYKVNNRTISKDKDGKKRHSVSLEVHNIDPHRGKHHIQKHKESMEGSESEEAMDKMMGELD